MRGSRSPHPTTRGDSGGFHRLRRKAKRPTVAFRGDSRFVRSTSTSGSEPKGTSAPPRVVRSRVVGQPPCHVALVEFELRWEPRYDLAHEDSGDEQVDFEAEIVIEDRLARSAGPHRHIRTRSSPDADSARRQASACASHRRGSCPRPAVHRTRSRVAVHGSRRKRLLNSPGQIYSVASTGSRPHGRRPVNTGDRC